MKDKIIVFFIGLLLGACISTGSIYFYTVANSSNNFNPGTEMNGGTPPSMSEGQNSGNGQPPAMPNSNNNAQNTEKTSNN